MRDFLFGRFDTLAKYVLNIFLSSVKYLMKQLQDIYQKYLKNHI